jgi:hypothetical protein
LLLLLAGQSLEKLRRFDEAFDRFQQAAHLRAARYDPELTARRYQVLKNVFSSTNLQRLPRVNEPDQAVVFIVGMPRSGSTLIEQIIHAHPSAHGAGEVPFLRDIVAAAEISEPADDPYPAAVLQWSQATFASIAKQYLCALRAAAPRAQRIVDKSLHNFERLGLIQLILPCARVIHARRHPLDTCLSCFSQPLQPVRHAYASDLTHLGAMFRMYYDLMSHWRNVLTLQQLDVDYESLVRQPEEWSRRIIEFIGLPWDDRCLRPHEARRTVLTLSHDQVNRPIYTSSINRFDNYAKHLTSLKSSLGELAQGWPK